MSDLFDDRLAGFVCGAFGIEREDLLGPRKFASYAEARAFFVHAARDRYPARSHGEIGRMLGGRDSSTIRALAAKADRLMEQGGRFADLVASFQSYERSKGELHAIH